MAALVPLINGRSYDWGSIIINIMGVPFTGVTSIDYEEKQDTKNIFGAGTRPISRGLGNIEPSAKITLLAEEVENLTLVAPLGNLMNIPEFDIVVCYIDSALLPKKHKLRNVRFMNNNRKVKQGDTSIGIDLELVLSHIEWI